MHIQGIGFHLADKQPGGDIGEALFVPSVGEQEEDHAGKGKKEAQAEEQLPEGNMGMFFQEITFRITLPYYMRDQGGPCILVFGLERNGKYEK